MSDRGRRNLAWAILAAIAIGLAVACVIAPPFTLVVGVVVACSAFAWAVSELV